MKVSNGYSADGVSQVTMSSVMREPIARPIRGPAAHQHHWSVYLVFASFCLLIAGLASDPRFQQIVREWFLSR